MLLLENGVVAELSQKAIKAEGLYTEGTLSRASHMILLYGLGCLCMMISESHHFNHQSLSIYNGIRRVGGDMKFHLKGVHLREDIYQVIQKRKPSDVPLAHNHIKLYLIIKQNTLIHY